VDISYFLKVGVPSLTILIVAIGIERLLTYYTSKSYQKRRLPAHHAHLLKLIGRWIITIVAIILIAGIFGVGLTNIWVVVSGIIAMALVGFFAAWSILSNILGTLIILAWHPFSIGDKISILPEALAGEVIDINLFYTKLKTEEGNIIHVPNVTFVTKFTSVSPTAVRHEHKRDVRLRK
jgi:small conductance mechanosensitive channel